MTSRFKCSQSIAFTNYSRVLHAACGWMWYQLQIVFFSLYKFLVECGCTGFTEYLILLVCTCVHNKSRNGILLSLSSKVTTEDFSLRPHSESYLPVFEFSFTIGEMKFFIQSTGLVPLVPNRFEGSPVVLPNLASPELDYSSYLLWLSTVGNHWSYKAGHAWFSVMLMPPLPPQMVKTGRNKTPLCIPLIKSLL